MASTLPYISREEMDELENELRTTKPGWSPDIDALQIAMLLDLIAAFRAGALSVPPAHELLEGRNSQHVLKAEGESPDATDRENCVNASPDGGPMGVGQAAAAAPVGDVNGPSAERRANIASRLPDPEDERD